MPCLHSLSLLTITSAEWISVFSCGFVVVVGNPFYLFWFWTALEKQPAYMSTMIVNFSRLKLWFAVSCFKNTSILMWSACSYISTIAAFSNAQSEVEGGMSAFSTLTVVFIMVYLRICNVFICSLFFFFNIMNTLQGC